MDGLVIIDMRCISHGMPPRLLSSARDVISLAAVEPDDEWKAQLRRRIQDNLQPMLQDARDSLASSIHEQPHDEHALIDHFSAYTVPNIQRMADDTFQAELIRERNERLWALQAGQAKPSPEYVKQQEEAMAKAKSTSTSTAAATAATATATATAATAATAATTMAANTVPVSVTSTSASAQASTCSTASQSRPQALDFLNDFPPVYHIPNLPPELEARRRTSDLHGGNATKPRDDFVGSLRRSSDHPESWTSTTAVIDTDLQRPRSTSIKSNQARMSPNPSNTSPSKSFTLDRSRTLSDRHIATSPASGKHEFWKPQISQEEDAASANKHYSMGRRSSNASMGSIGSTNSALRTAETIPERVDDTWESSGDSKVKGRERSGFSAASAAAAAVRQPLSSSPISVSSASYPKMPLVDEPASYSTPLRTIRNSHSTMNGNDERYPPLSSRTRNLDSDDGAGGSDSLNFMNDGIAGPDLDYHESVPYVRQYHERQSLSRLTSVSRLRDDHGGRDGKSVIVHSQHSTFFQMFD